MKKSFTSFSLLLVLGSFFPGNSLLAQSVPEAEGRNLVRFNAGSLLFKTISFEFEHAVASRTSVGVGLRVAPKGRLPFSNAVADLLEDDQLSEMKTGNFAITPQVRFYFGQGVFKGFYLSPFLRAAFYDAAVDYRFTVYDQQRVLPLSGDFSAYTIGLAIGAQWHLGRNFYLDWAALGPHYGFSKGKVTGYQTLGPEEQEALRQELRDLDDFPFGKIRTTVDQAGAVIDFDGPWAGLRMNVGIGYRF
ncbi:DUF3575 domain-containing protein [Pedobacter yulinensis]|uniref:DUF3575 domain-containing protein n=1 Tax=Pedobacter yulinensis TaxID=2126353 RepID=A0A2T3HRB5_9SPHI|nr:DUF3575 domain-containing protein [Pedobacter yulinensis]PST85010.1 DUF3575 domain-containing protein [Pedobacter yulinensis]